MDYIKKNKKILTKKMLNILYLDITKIKKNLKFEFDFDYIINLAGNINHKTSFKLTKPTILESKIYLK